MPRIRHTPGRFLQPRMQNVLSSPFKNQTQFKIETCFRLFSCLVAIARGNKNLGRAVLGSFCLQGGAQRKQFPYRCTHYPQAFIMADVCLRNPEFSLNFCQPENGMAFQDVYVSADGPSFTAQITQSLN